MDLYRMQVTRALAKSVHGFAAIDPRPVTTWWIARAYQRLQSNQISRFDDSRLPASEPPVQVRSGCDLGGPEKCDNDIGTAQVPPEETSAISGECVDLASSWFLGPADYGGLPRLKSFGFIALIRLTCMKNTVLVEIWSMPQGAGSVNRK